MDRPYLFQACYLPKHIRNSIVANANYPETKLCQIVQYYAYDISEYERPRMGVAANIPEANKYFQEQIGFLPNVAILIQIDDIFEFSGCAEPPVQDEDNGWDNFYNEGIARE